MKLVAALARSLLRAELIGHARTSTISGSDLAFCQQSEKPSGRQGIRSPFTKCGWSSAATAFAALPTALPESGQPSARRRASRALLQGIRDLEPIAIPPLILEAAPDAPKSCLYSLCSAPLIAPKWIPR